MTARTFGTTAALAAVVCFSACSFSPVAHRIKVGEEPYIVFVGEGVDHNTDLFAVPAGGGAVAQVTFTPLVERGPRLSPDGEFVAFLRMRDTLPATPRDVVLMSLLGGGEYPVVLPADAGVPQAVVWSGDSHALYIRTDHTTLQSAVPPAKVAVTPSNATGVATTDSALQLWLGQPAFARVVNCPTGGLCTIGPSGDTTPLAPAGRDALRWGSDSVGWFQDDALIVRSLGPGRERRVSWTGGPTHPRQPTYTPGPPAQP